ncbi:MAG: hypothetical protein IJD12_06170 [Tidjanibacter sp.]|nr:hypothetical protein [Tidjanibacter sp.]
MNTRRHGRIVHYCNLLKLRSWDKKDVIDYLDAYFENPRSTNSMSLRKKILQLELDNIADSIIDYINGEERDFKEYKTRYPDTPDELIWPKIYGDYDKLINQHITQAKDVARTDTAAKGCFYFSYLIPVIILIIILCTNC